VIRNAAVPVAGFGSNFSLILLFIGLMLSARVPQLGHSLVLGGLALYGAVVFFQLVNLPVEFNASSRAKVQLVQLGIVSPEEMVYVNRVLDAAALTYVAATLQALLTLLYYIFRFSNRRSGW